MFCCWHQCEFYAVGVCFRSLFYVKRRFLLYLRWHELGRVRYHYLGRPEEVRFLLLVFYEKTFPYIFPHLFFVVDVCVQDLGLVR